jgi:hypothetical protein
VASGTTIWNSVIAGSVRWRKEFDRDGAVEEAVGGLRGPADGQGIGARKTPLATLPRDGAGGLLMLKPVMLIAASRRSRELVALRVAG